MHLHEMLRPELIKIGLEAEKKRETISELIDVLIQYHEVPMRDREALLEQLYANEDALGSGMEKGIALPHIATDRVEDVICALGTAPRGIDFGTLDGQPARLVALLLVPKRDYESEVAAIATIEELLEDDNLVQRLLKAISPQEAWKILEAAESGK